MSDGEGRVFEMQWDCQFCGATKMLGKTHRFCPNCGAPQNPDSRYFPTEDEAVEVHDHVYVGADVTCGACGELNAGNSEFCQQCGAPLTDAAKAKTLGEQRRAKGDAFTTSEARDLVKEKFDAEMERVGVKKKKKEPISKVKIFAILGVIGVIIAGLIFVFTAKDSVTVTAQGHTWERTIDIEEFQQVRDGAWQSSVPGDAYNRSCSRKQSGTKRVADGQECQTVRRDNGDGTFRQVQECQTRYREEPVYDTWCDYTVDRWLVINIAKTNGTLDNTPDWPETSLNCAGQNRLGCEREGTRAEEYLVTFRGDENREYHCGFSQDEWSQIPIESVWSVDVRKFDRNAADCDSLTRN